ncbi:MAG: hypothetical protein HY974_04125 [Candidatus Kerfeldbacteria bacterium]|nr:hypothetical protein [Candidatus Kerfeldbacteria bacterium]
MAQSKFALISVADKKGLVEFAEPLPNLGFTILSTGGTAKALRAGGVPVTEVPQHTGFPEILGGRVKTLHPKIHGGILSRSIPDDQAEILQHGIEPIDLVIVNLYPFSVTVAKGASFEEAIEQIDIGGPTMLRSAAKNHQRVTVVSDTLDYLHVLNELQHGGTSPKFRMYLAAKVFFMMARYEQSIFDWFRYQVDEPYNLQLAQLAAEPNSR